MRAAFTAAPPDIYAFALAGLMRIATDCPSIDDDVRGRLIERQGTAGRIDGSLLTAFKASLLDPTGSDSAIVEVARQFSLTLVEILSLRLAMAAEEDVDVSYVIAQLQSPIAGHRPTVGLLARAFHESLEASAAQIIGHGEAVRTGILRLSATEYNQKRYWQCGCNFRQYTKYLLPIHFWYHNKQLLLLKKKQVNK